METYTSGEVPVVGDVVRFVESWWWWRIFDQRKMIVLSIGNFDSGARYVEVGWICEGNEILRILTHWNPQNFILMRK